MHHLRINGRGNAWPLQIQKTHAMYQENGSNDYANASFSICKSKNDVYNAFELEWEILIDAGHGIIPFILNHHNRIPDAIVLTHAHFDHILSIDWIVQSYYRQYNKQFPIYASQPCIEAFDIVLHHLNGLIEWHILKVGETTNINEAPGLNVTNYPVYHGYSAKGSSMLMFSEDNSSKKILLTGDILCPLLKARDYKIFSDIELMLVDCNNRFPYPESNHWSFSNNGSNSKIQDDFIESFELTSLLKPHYMSESEKEYILDVMSENTNANSLCWNILDFIDKTNPTQIGLVHYSGSEDEKYYNEPILNSKQLEQWANKKAKENEVSSAFIVPKTGDIYNIFN